MPGPTPATTPRLDPRATSPSVDTNAELEILEPLCAVFRKKLKSGFRVSKATVYRTIKLLQEAGIIQRALFDEEQTHYQVVYGKSPKDMIVRMDTGQTIQVDIPELEKLRDAICRAHGLEPKGHRLTIFAVGK